MKFIPSEEILVFFRPSLYLLKKLVDAVKSPSVLSTIELSEDWLLVRFKPGREIATLIDNFFYNFSKSFLLSHTASDNSAPIILS